jgi:hypothetical protein
MDGLFDGWIRRQAGTSTRTHISPVRRAPVFGYSFEGNYNAYNHKQNSEAVIE